MEAQKNPRVGSSHPSKILVKYFVQFYPYSRKNKINGATRPRQFCLVTDKSWRENVNQLALMEAMPLEEFILRVLSEKMIEELQDPMLYRRHIPDY
jgi:hypothetical protein